MTRAATRWFLAARLAWYSWLAERAQAHVDVLGARLTLAHKDAALARLMRSEARLALARYDARDS